MLTDSSLKRASVLCSQCSLPLTNIPQVDRTSICRQNITPPCPRSKCPPCSQGQQVLVKKSFFGVGRAWTGRVWVQLASQFPHHSRRLRSRKASAELSDVPGYQAGPEPHRRDGTAPERLSGFLRCHPECSIKNHCQSFVTLSSFQLLRNSW